MQQIGWDSVQGIVLDLGVSSMQLDTPERGFSFLKDGPLDMRFGPSQTTTAADLVNQLPERELADLIWQFGEDRNSRRIARAIVQGRPFATTRELAKAMEKTAGSVERAPAPGDAHFSGAAHRGQPGTCSRSAKCSRSRWMPWRRAGGWQ